VAVLALSLVAAEPVSSQTSVTVAIDVDVTGNDARTAGSIENCARMGSGGDVDVDVVVPDPGIPSDVGVKGWQFNLLYDPNVVRVSGHDPHMLLDQAEGSDLLVAISDQPPDSDGSFTSAGVDFSQRIGIEPDGAQETGPGVIARITLSAVGDGATNLKLENLALVDADNHAVPIGKLQEAAVSVNQPCTPPPLSTSPPTNGPNGGTGTDNLPPGATPSPGANGDASPPGGGPTDGETNEQGTPILGGSPVSGDNGGAGGDASAGGGLSTGAWAGIGAGIAAAALAASGAGWFALRKLRAGGPPTSGGDASRE